MHINPLIMTRTLIFVKQLQNLQSVKGKFSWKEKKHKFLAPVSPFNVFGSRGIFKPLRREIPYQNK